MKKETDDTLKEMYADIEVAAELDKVINNAISRAERQRRRTSRQRRAMLGFAALFACFAISINTIPAFAAFMGELPGVGRIVNILRLNNDTAGGGEITDGQQVGPIIVENETLTIFFSEGMPNSVLPWYQATYKEYPYSLVLELGGVRSLFADGQLPSFAGSDLIDDMYRLITLDDSAQRYVITFSQAVDVEVRELANQAALQIAVSPAVASASEPVYAVRTASVSFGEHVGYMEEMLFHALDFQTETLRMLRDIEGTYFVEAAYFGSESEALAFRDSLLHADLDFPLYVEVRHPDNLPAFIAP